MADERPAILSLETLHAGFSTFMVGQVRLKDGAVVRREIEHHGDAVAVLPFDPVRRTALLIRLFRVAPLYLRLEAELEEAPAGLIDEAESQEAAARRETLEETGATVVELERVGRIWVSPGISTERITLYLAPCDAATRSAGGGASGEHENITVLETPLAELGRRACAGEIDDMKLLILVQALQLRRPELFG